MTGVVIGEQRLQLLCRGVAVGATYGAVVYKAGMGVSMSVAVGAVAGLVIGVFLQRRSSNGKDK